MSTPNYELYFEHALTLNEEELQLQERYLDEIPDNIVDTHVHAASAKDVNVTAIPEHIQRHMMSTYPITSFEQSQKITELLMPGKEVRKLRFAHVFPGIGHSAVNQYLIDGSPEGDKTALFGLSDGSEQIDYTISELRSGKYAGLKMYYIASVPPKYELYEYFPPEILESAQKQEVPIILHLPHSLYRSDDEVVSLAENYPNLKIVLAHVGVAHLPRPELETVLAKFGEYSNIYADTARVHSAEIIAAAIRHLGSERLLYGSDEPLNLLRSVAFFNPDLQSPRVLTDFPYHWVDPDEQKKWHHLAPRFVHSQWEQMEAIVSALDLLQLSQSARDRMVQNIFQTNAERIFGFSN